MASLKSWVKAMRLRTLPLSLATVLTGNFLAMAGNSFLISVMIFSVITTIFLQILSNLANDLGDHLKGTDNEHRIGPARATQTGEISPSEMKKTVLLFTLLSFCSGILLLVFSKIDRNGFLVFLSMGIAAILAAIFYTLGKRPYGYRAMGDIFVFIFFGLVGVGGSFYLNTGIIVKEIFLPATAIGFFSAAVLNMNNMRDHDNDKNQGKNTLVVLLGLEKAKWYHTFLIVGALTCVLIFILKTYVGLQNLVVILVFPLYIMNLFRVWKITNPKHYDPELKKLAIATLLFALLLGIGIIPC